MLSNFAGELAVEPVIVNSGDIAKGVVQFLNRDVPMFIKEKGLLKEKIKVVSREHLIRASSGERVQKFSTQVIPAKMDTPLYEVSKLLLEYEVDSYPIAGESLLGITENTVISAIPSTHDLGKREAKMVMSPCPIIRESKLKNAGNVASQHDLSVLPVVNDSGKLIGMWLNGKLMKKPIVAREGTRVKLFAEKVKKNPVIVIDKRRNPIGIITKRDLLELAATFQEYKVPIFYTGVGTLGKKEAEFAKSEILSTIKRISKITSVSHSSIRVVKRGTWSVKIKLSTSLRTFISMSEAETHRIALEDALAKLVKEVLQEKDKRVKLRRDV
ncbi:MAG: CBS domain-containing protein [Candidatus Altiarchaeota archaeon]|nr:CBS domain-containing protein [Candidatus Altiarchaeota archaeon]